MHRRQHPVDAAAEPLPQQRGEGPGFDCEPLRQHGLSQCGRQQDAVAEHEPAWRGEPAMGGDEIARRQAIAVEENA